MRLLFIGLFSLSIILLSCKKDSTTQSTISLLQNKWLIKDETTVVPNPCGVLQRVIYTGTPTDYYLFDKNDSIKINRSGSIGFTTNQIDITLKYTLVNNNKIIFINPSTNYHDTATILKITSDSLIL